MRFARLGVAVVDEQHRFGVRQRAALDAKASAIRRGAAARPAHDRDADPADAGAGQLRRPRLHAAARAARRGAARSRRSCARPPVSESARTTGSARSSGPAARRSSSARWWRSPRCSRLGRRRPSSSACVDGELRDFERGAAARPAALGGQAGRDGRVRDAGGGRAGGHVGDRGRDRRAERHRDARRGRRPIRDLAAAPAAGPDRAGRARLDLPAVRLQGLVAAAGAGRAHRRVRARRDRPRASRRGRAGRHAPARGGAVPGGRAAARRRAARARAGATPSRSWRSIPSWPRPSTRCSRMALVAAFGAEALAPIRA